MQIRTVRENQDLEVRYAWMSYGEWVPVSWRVPGGQWRSCRSPRTAERLGFEVRKCLPEVK